MVRFGLLLFVLGVLPPARAAADAGLAPAADPVAALAEARSLAEDPATTAAGRAALQRLVAQAPPRIAAEAAWRLGRALETAGDLAGATEAYLAVGRLDPGGRFARSAVARLTVLRAVPPADQAVVAGLEALQREPTAVDPEVARAQVTQWLAAAAAPATRVRLWRWRIEQALASEDRAAAFEHALGLGAEPGIEPLARRVAFERALEAATGADLDRLAEALAEAQVRWPEVPLDEVVHEVKDRRLRRRVVPGLLASVVLLLGFAVRARAWRALAPPILRRWRPWRSALFLLWAFGGAAWLAQAYEPRTGLPVFACGVAILPVHLLAGAVGQVAPPRRVWTRILLALAVVGATLAGCYLVLARVDRLAWIGL